MDLLFFSEAVRGAADGASQQKREKSSIQQNNPVMAQLVPIILLNN